MAFQKNKLNPFRLILLGFAGIILFGTILLMLPISSADHLVTPFTNALFTATSAVCVTGLVVVDTASYWSPFGQTVILGLIQIGGLGIITVTGLIFMVSGRKISLLQRSTMKEAISAHQLGGIVRLTRFFVKTAILIELAGALIMLPVFCESHGARGIWMALFHSVSAFCNAGFDIMGTPNNQFPSLTGLSGNAVINVTIPLLIIVGGIGFMTWDDIRQNRFHWRRYRMQTKVILSTTAILLIVPTLLFYNLEFEGSPGAVRLFFSFFQSATTRTAGFNTADLTKMSGAAHAVMIILMLIGGSPGSTAGGMKTTTAAVLFGNAFGVFRRESSGHFFGRRIEEGTVNAAATILILYIVLFSSSAMIISRIENVSPGICFFETASAIGTVGLSLGITPKLHMISRYILIALMYLGRVGGLTAVYGAFSKNRRPLSKLPQEKLMVG